MDIYDVTMIQMDSAKVFASEEVKSLITTWQTALLGLHNDLMDAHRELRTHEERESVFVRIEDSPSMDSPTFGDLQSPPAASLRPDRPDSDDPIPF